MMSPVMRRYQCSLRNMMSIGSQSEMAATQRSSIKSTFISRLINCTDYWRLVGTEFSLAFSTGTVLSCHRSISRLKMRAKTHRAVTRNFFWRPSEKHIGSAQEIRDQDGKSKRATNQQATKNTSRELEAETPACVSDIRRSQRQFFLRVVVLSVVSGFVFGSCESAHRRRD